MVIPRSPPGSMYSVPTPVDMRNSRIAVAMNSGPLSLWMCFGALRVGNSPTRMSITSSEVIEPATSSATHSRVNSSTTVSHFPSI